MESKIQTQLQKIIQAQHESLTCQPSLNASPSQAQLINKAGINKHARVKSDIQPDIA